MDDTTTTSGPQAPERRLVRPVEDRWFGGVAEGLGRYFDMSPTVYRIAFAALALAGGTGVLIYMAAWLIIPDEDDSESIAERVLRDHRDQPILLIGAGVLALAFIAAISHAELWSSPGSLWTAIVIAGLALIWWGWQAGRASPPSDDDIVASVEFHGVPASTAAAAAPVGDSQAQPTPAAGAAARTAAKRGRRRKPVLFLPVVGIVAAAVSVFALLQVLDVTNVDWRFGLVGAIALVNLGALAGLAAGRSVAALVGLGLLLGAVLIVAVAVDVPFKGGIGSRVERPVTAAELRDTYRLAVGELELDLGNAPLPPGDTRIQASVGVGQLRVTVPRDVEVEVDGHAGIGELDVLGRTSSGIATDRTVNDAPPSSTRRLTLEADVGIGKVEVVRR